MNVVFRPSIRSKQQRLHVLFTGCRGLGVPLNLFLGVAKKDEDKMFPSFGTLKKKTHSISWDNSLDK